MASQLIREWVGIQHFPAATQTKLLELLGKLKHENVNSLTILVMGKGGVGKSSTVNSIVGERAVSVSAFQSEGLRPVMVSRSRAGFSLHIIDTPGLIEGGYVNLQTLEIIKRFLLDKTIDVLLYVDRLDTYRVDNLDKQIVGAITDGFGKEIWKRALVVLTHAQLSPPDGLDYDLFFKRRSEALLNVVHAGAKLRKQDISWASNIPVVLVENSGRCSKNEDEEKILPDGSAWIPSLVKKITDVALNESKGIKVDKELIEGPNPNRKWKGIYTLGFGFRILCHNWVNSTGYQEGYGYRGSTSMGDAGHSINYPSEKEITGSSKKEMMAWQQSTLPFLIMLFDCLFIFIHFCYAFILDLLFV